jgi:hypothetical protein
MRLDWMRRKITDAPGLDRPQLDAPGTRCDKEGKTYAPQNLRMRRDWMRQELVGMGDDDDASQRESDPAATQSTTALLTSRTDLPWRRRSDTVSKKMRLKVRLIKPIKPEFSISYRGRSVEVLKSNSNHNRPQSACLFFFQ